MGDYSREHLNKEIYASLFESHRGLLFRRAMMMWMISSCGLETLKKFIYMHGDYNIRTNRGDIYY